VREKPRSAGPADEVGNASTSPNREETLSSSAEVIPALLRELAHSPEILSGAAGPALDSVHLPPGACLGPYRIVTRLGSGGMGVVHEAHDVRLGRRVALKFLSAERANDADARSRFRREARAASALNHPHICTIHDVGEHEGAPYLVMELLQGETLLDRLARGPLPPDEFFNVALAVVSALEAAGDRGIVHRDLKPANVFLTRSGAKVLDFGLARIGEAGDAPPTQIPTLTNASRWGEPTRTGAMMGTLHYMSPEQVRGEPVDARTDLFSFGVVLYEMVAGRRPFVAGTAGLIADAILHLDPVPPDVERLGFPPGLAGVIGRALDKELRHRYQTAAELGADLLRLRAAPGSRHAGIAALAMPAPPSSFVGRIAELVVVKEALSRARLVTLTGPGGIGKTRLALRVARDSVPRHADGVFFVPLAAVRDPNLLDSAIAQAVGLREVPDLGLAEHLVQHLAGRELLLVLDSFEHLLPAASRAADLLRSAPRLTLLVTSRDRLHLSAEAEVAVPPLGLPGPDTADPDAFRASESVALFCERAAAVQAGFALSDENAAVVAEICARLDGLPLAIELAAARVRHLTPATLLQQLSRRLALLTGVARDLPARQRTLRDVIAWSHDLLSTEEQTLFAWLAVFDGGFTLEAAEAVSAAVGPLGLQILDGIASLVDKSLLRQSSEGDELRYAMLETIREFGLERLAAGGEAARAPAAHAAHFVALEAGTQAQLHGRRLAAHLELPSVELDNSRAALAWRVSDGGEREGEGTWTRPTRRKVVLAMTTLLLVLGGGIFWRYEYAAAPPSARAPFVAGTTADAGLSMVSTTRMLPDRPSLAVLPFDSLGGSSENSYFADGMTDDIITDLSKLSGILIIARNSSWTYKGKSVKVQQVAKDLGVRYVLQGSVRREGETIRINAQLVDTLGGQHLWAERYDGSIRDVFALQDKVIGQIVAALAVKLTHDEQTRLDLAETGNPQAYDAVLRGLAYYRQGSEDGTNKAIARFEQAIALDPGYARAHAALAAASWRVVQSYWESTTEGGYQRAFDRMQAALVKAMRQPNALAHAVTAEVLSKQGRYEEAFTEIGNAMALAPNDPENHLSKARILNATGQAALAEESVRWAMRLDPLYSPDYLRTLAMSLFNQQRYEEAVEALERPLALKTDVADDYITLIASLGHLGHKSGIPDAIQRFNQLSVSAGYNTITVQMFGGWWWYGDMFNYEPAYRDRLMQGLRKAGVPEGAGTDIPFEQYRRLMHKSGGYFEVTGAITVDHQRAKTLHDRHVKFVDVRSAKGFAEGHVPGAFNLDVATELSRESLSRIVSKDEEFVLSCHGKTCPDSAYASAKALIWGFKQVYYFSGGFPAWEEAGYPVEASPRKAPPHRL
jgi:adenylate cyclase